MAESPLYIRWLKCGVRRQVRQVQGVHAELDILHHLLLSLLSDE
jgi:hypothetical protein